MEEIEETAISTFPHPPKWWQGLPFLDTITSRRGTEIQVDVYRKPTHTDRYLDSFSCHHLCHKRSVYNTLLRRANNIPSTNKGRREETQRVKAVLRDNNYPMSSIQNCERVLTTKPYVQGVSEKIGRTLNQQKVEVLQTTTNDQQPFSTPERARRF